jgi:hypothetical protein
MNYKNILSTKKRNDFDQESIMDYLEKNIYNKEEYDTLFFIFCTYDLINPVKFMLKEKLVDKKIKTKALLETIIWGKTRIILKLLKEDIDINYNKNEIIYRSAIQATIPVFKYVLNNFKFEVNYDNNILFDNACKHGRKGVVKELLKEPLIDPTANNFKGFNSAVELNKTGTVKLLLEDERINPINNNYKALKIAIKKLNFDMIKVLFSHKNVNPSFNNNELLILFANDLRVYFKDDKKTNQRKKIYKLLISDERVIKSLSNETLEHIKNNDMKNIIKSIYVQNKIIDF